MPCSKLNNKFVSKIIVKLIKKTSTTIALSENLQTNKNLIKLIEANNIKIIDGKMLFYYILLDCLKYISKNMNTEVEKQEISILLKNNNEFYSKIIIYLAKKVKRINIVTTNINSFKRLENYLQDELGISMTITNNKRKSLLKSKIVMNLDFDEELINCFSINSNAIIINPKEKINIKSKSFTGINICGYDITYKNQNNKYKNFHRNIIYESLIYDINSYEGIRKRIEKDDIKIVNLIGQNGIIDTKEYLRI